VVLEKDEKVQLDRYCEEGSFTLSQERNTSHTTKRRQVNSIGHMLRRNCFIKHVSERKVEEKTEQYGIRGKRRDQLLDIVKGRRRYWKLEETEYLML